MIQKYRYTFFFFNFKFLLIKRFIFHLQREHGSNSFKKIERSS